MRTIQDLPVKCNNYERGCEWSGAVATLERHVSTCQYAVKTAVTQYTKMECLKCSEDIERMEADVKLCTKCLGKFQYSEE